MRPSNAEVVRFRVQKVRKVSNAEGSNLLENGVGLGFSGSASLMDVRLKLGQHTTFLDAAFVPVGELWNYSVGAPRLLRKRI